MKNMTLAFFFLFESTMRRDFIWLSRKKRKKKKKVRQEKKRGLLALWLVKLIMDPTVSRVKLSQVKNQMVNSWIVVPTRSFIYNFWVYIRLENLPTFQVDLLIQRLIAVNAVNTYVVAWWAQLMLVPPTKMIKKQPIR